MLRRKRMNQAIAAVDGKKHQQNRCLAAGLGRGLWSICQSLSSSLSAFSPRLGGKIAVPREAAALVGNVPPSLAASFGGQGAVLAEAPFFIGHALAALGGDGAMRLGIHGGEAAG